MIRELLIDKSITVVFGVVEGTTESSVSRDIPSVIEVCMNVPLDMVILIF